MLIDGKKYLSSETNGLKTVQRKPLHQKQKKKRKNTDVERSRREVSGLSNEADTPETIKKIYQIGLNDRENKFHKLADVVKISKELVDCSLHNHSSKRKLW